MSDLIPYNRAEITTPQNPMDTAAGLQVALEAVQSALNSAVARREIIERGKTARTAILERAEIERAAIFANMKTEIAKIEAAIANDQNLSVNRMRLIDYAGQLALNAQSAGTLDAETLKAIDLFLQRLDRLR